MVKRYGNTVTLTNIWVSYHDNISDFYASSWQRGESAVPMLVIRLLLAAVSISILVFSLVMGATPYWLIYLTNWGLLIITMMTLSGVAVSIFAMYKKPYNDTTELPWFVSMYWLLHNVGCSIAIMITALYWILLYDPDAESDEQHSFWLDLATHGFNSCVVVVEVASARTPMHLLHFYQPLGVGLWYAAFTAIYYAAGGTDAFGNPYVYEVLNWNDGGRAGSIVGISVAGVIAIYVVLWALALCRDMVSTSLVRTTSHDLPPTPPDNIMHTRMV